MTLCQKCYLFFISEFSWKDFVTRNEINQFLFLSHAVDVLAYVLHVFDDYDQLPICSNGLWYRRQPPRLGNLHSFGLVASLVNTLPKRPPYATECSSHQLPMCERGAVTPDVACTAEHQSTTIASHQFTISNQAEYNVMSNYICKLWVVEVRDVVLLYYIF